jgi:hypothetical protein
MRFIIMAMATKESEASVPPPPEAFVAMQEYNAELVKAGTLLAAEGLAPTSKGARVKFSGDKRTVIDGPFTETKELVAGFSIVRVKSLEEAIELVKRAPNVSPNGEGEVEIRKLMDVEDSGDGFTPNPEIAKVKFKSSSRAGIPRRGHRGSPMVGRGSARRAHRSTRCGR